MTKITLSIATAVLAFAAIATPAFAYTPMLSITPTNNSMVAITVTGDANSSIQLYYLLYNQNYTNASLAGTIGFTNNAGYFSITIPTSSYNIPAGASVFVTVNSQQSAQISWPNAGYYSGYNWPYPYQSNIPSFQTGSVSVGVNQTSTVSGQNGVSYAVSSNSNASIVSATASGNMITFRGNSVGQATVVVCPVNNYYPYNYNYGYNYNNYYGTTYAGPCTSFFVTVTPALTFSQSNVTLYGIGSGQSVNISGGYTYNTYPYNYYGAYYLSNNTNSSVVSAAISGNTLNIYALDFGGATLTVCAANGACGHVYVSVNGSNSYYSYPYSFYSSPYFYPQNYFPNPY